MGDFSWKVSDCEELVGEEISGGLVMVGTYNITKKLYHLKQLGKSIEVKVI